MYLVTTTSMCTEIHSNNVTALQHSSLSKHQGEAQENSSMVSRFKLT